MSLKLGLYRNKHKLCCSEICKDLPSHSHSENNLKNQLLDNLLRPTFTRAPGTRTRFQKDLFCHFRKMPRTNSPIACLPKSIQTGTTLRNRTKSPLGKSSPRSLQEPETSTKTTWTFYSYKTSN